MVWLAGAGSRKNSYREGDGGARQYEQPWSLSDYALFPHLSVIFEKSMLAIFAYMAVLDFPKMP